eukprot:197059-Lingulodinium_polyedra.AAC.1
MAQVCHSANEAEMRAMAKLCEVGKAFLKGKARDLVLGAGDLPVFVHYSSDATPMSTKHRIKAGQMSKKVSGGQ